jgi:serine/threonine protein kinase
MPVAVKTLNPNSPDDNEIKFLKEAAIMGQFLHTNVVKLLGVVTVGQPVSESKWLV